MTKEEKAIHICRLLKDIYPNAECTLQYGSDPWRLLVMGILSAQCTDKRVNEVCIELFKSFPTPERMSCGDISEIERLIFACGLYKTKAKNIKEASYRICNTFGGKVPDTMEQLLTLPGVGRKIANLILGDIYGKPAIVADTHCIRISARLGLSSDDGERASALLTERRLAALVPPSESSELCHRIVQFGRDICSSADPKCEKCPFSNICIYYKHIS